MLAPSPILAASARVIVPTLGLASIVVLFQGHNLPGGGFIGGLMLTAVVALRALTFGSDSARRLLRFHPITFLAAGLTAALVSGFFRHEAGFLAAAWTQLALPGLEPLKLGTPMLFDVAVFLVVVGGASLMLLTLMEDAP